MSDKELRSAGLKVTIPRVKILEILENSSRRHLSAEEVHRLLVEAGDDVGLATVYRVLTQFEQVGLVTRHNFESDHAVFELDSGEHHDHMVCLSCTKVVEFLDDLIEQQQLEIAKAHDFKISGHSLILYGFCLACQGESA